MGQASPGVDICVGYFLHLPFMPSLSFDFSQYDNSSTRSNTSCPLWHGRNTSVCEVNEPQCKLPFWWGGRKFFLIPTHQQSFSGNLLLQGRDLYRNESYRGTLGITFPFSQTPDNSFRILQPVLRVPMTELLKQTCGHRFLYAVHHTCGKFFHQILSMDFDLHFSK